MDMISGLRDRASQPGSRTVHPDIADSFSLDGRVAVITGAAMGLGRSTAVTLAKAGADVVLADVAVDELEQTAAMVVDAGGRAEMVPTDVSSRTAVEDLARAGFKLSGRLDVWANVAGVIRRRPITEMTEEDLDFIIGVNLKGTYWGVAVAARVMATKKSGAIVNVASGGAEMPAPGISAYGASKAGVIQLTRVAATELGPSGIRVNAVAPGFVETPMTQQNWTSGDGTVDEETRSATLAAMAGRSPLGSNGSPQDIANAILYLASDASSFVTGQVLRVNGGVHML